MGIDEELRHQLAMLVRVRGYERREWPVQLSSGGFSYDYVDSKRVLAQGAALSLVSQAVVSAVDAPFDVVGGPTMGADALAHGVALLSGTDWFSVRKEPKGHGLQAWVEGSKLNPGDRVVFVEDVVSTGASLLRAVDRVLDLGVTPVAAVTLLDRSPVVARRFAARGIPYYPLLTWRDIGIDALPDCPDV